MPFSPVLIHFPDREPIVRVAPAAWRALLPHSGHLQEEEADYANEGGYSKHAPCGRSIPKKMP
jgi:hypothetical protein